MTSTIKETTLKPKKIQSQVSKIEPNLFTETTPILKSENYNNGVRRYDGKY